MDSLNRLKYKKIEYKVINNEVKTFNGLIELRDLLHDYLKINFSYSNKLVMALSDEEEESLDELTAARQDLDAVFNAEYRYKSSYKSMFNFNDFDSHNIINDTFGKKKVPTISVNYKRTIDAMYCPHCNKNHSNINCKGTIEINKRENTNSYCKVDFEEITCLECNTTYKIDDMKIVHGNQEDIIGEVYYDENKISVSYKYISNSIKRDRQSFYYEEGYKRITFNTKTGYSFTTSKGHAYKEMKILWDRYNKKAPMLFNSTYSFMDGTGGILCKVINARKYNYLKSLPKEERIKLIEQNYLKDNSKEVDELENEIFKAMHKKIQENYNYKIKTIEEYMTELNVKKNDYHDVIRIMKNYNRYINLNPFADIMNYLINKDYELERTKIGREEINVINAIFKSHKVNLGKKTRALTQNEVYNSHLLVYSSLLVDFKNPDILNKLFNSLLKDQDKLKGLSSSYYISNIRSTINLWTQFRSENYIAKELMRSFENNENNLENKLNYMRDSVKMIDNISNNIDDFKIEDYVTFKNEKQFHDDLSRYYNSDEYHYLVQKEEYEKVFKLEKEVLALEDENNNIFVAKNRGKLSHIGRQMNICVGGYSSMVESDNCRIAYITDDNGEYKACLELRPYKVGNKQKYKLVQAKLKYNRPPYQDMEIYDKIALWANNNKIDIDTYDMELPKKINNKAQIEIRAIGIQEDIPF